MKSKFTWNGSLSTLSSFVSSFRTFETCHRQRLLASISRTAVLLYPVLLGIGWGFGAAHQDIAVPELRPMNEPVIHGMVTTALVAYVLLAAIPFVPDAEVGLALLLLFGAKAAPVVHVGLVGALVLAYFTARLVPIRVLTAAFRWLGLRKPAEVFHMLEGRIPR